VSFCPLEQIAPAVSDILKPNRKLLALVKPQFELDPLLVPEGGIIKDPELHQRAVEVAQKSLESHGVKVLKTIPARPRGTQGNQEFFILAQK
jgi:23S rRNA (cytidine1920-2'-O)/16S rRNA (cytidine1409-2'-O)-methyltransferase